MYTYDEPMVVAHSYAQHDFASGDTKEIVGPKGMRGKVLDVLVNNVTATFTNVTTEGKVQAGVSGELGKFADFGLGTLAAGSATAASRTTGAVKQAMLADTETLLVTFVAPTGGVPAGTADVQVIVGWYY